MGPAGPQGATGEAGPKGEPGESFAAGSVVLVQSPSACPKGWAQSGQTILMVTNDYQPGPEQEESFNGVLLSGMANLSFFMCVKG
jgi:hypothetical protein